jgi:iron complex outermembrane receptor protein
MQTKPKRLVHRLVSAGVLPCAAAGLAFAPGALAQAPVASVERIEITGSNIKRIDAEGPLPIQVITRAEIEKSAAPSIGDLLRGLSVNSGGSFAENAVNNQSGAAGISLRGLGQKSTLVLINGRRMANHAFAQGNQDTFVDLHSIPKSAVERIEILKDGASAIYGSDAIAGVVNVILRRDYRGVEVAANSGSASEGGLNERGASLSVGVGSLGKDKYNVLAVVDYFHRDRMMLSDRAFLNDLDFRFLPGGTFFPATSGGTWVRPGGVTTGTARTPLTNCIAPSRVGPANIIVPQLTGQSCNYTVTDTLTAFPEADRLGVFVRANRELRADLRAFGELSLSRNESAWINQPQTMTNTTVSFNPATGGFRTFSNVFPANYANNPYGRPASLNYTFFDVGNRTFGLTTDAFRLLGGVSGTTGRWEWEGAVGVSQSKISQTTGNQVDGAALAGFIANPTGGGYNFLAPTPEQTARLRISTVRNATSKLAFGDVKGSTELTQLAGGPMGLAVGFEWRRESLVDTPDEAIRQGRLLGTGASATDGSRTAYALFGELVAPIGKTLELSVAARGDKYNDFGSAFSPKIGGKWIPNKQFLVRASHARGFRAPTLVENTASSSLGFASLTQNGVGTIIGVATVASKDLKPEKSESSSIGVVFEPVPWASFATDFYRIEQKNLVATSGVNFIVANAALFPGAVVRDANGTIIVVFDRYSNVSKVETSGFDVDGALRFPATGFGKFTLRGNVSKVISYKQPPAINTDLVQYAGRNAGPNGLVLPRVRGKLALDFERGPLAITLTGNHTGAYAQRATNVPPADAFVRAHNTADLYIAYTGIKNLKLALSVTNLEDRDPPYDVSTGVGISNQVYDLRSRYTRFQLEYKFR